MKLTPTIQQLMESFGIDQDGAFIYLHLLQKGPKTALTISRETEYSRTKIYTILEELIEKGFVNEVLNDYGRRFEANAPENLKFLLADREQTVLSLEESLPEIIDSLSNLAQEDISHSKIKYYTGIKGLRQVTWNETQAKDEFRIYEITEMTDFLDKKFSAEVLLEFVKNKIYDKQLTNIDNYFEYTDVTEFVKKYWELKYINPKELKIDFETMVYNDVVCMYDFVGNDIFCVEIYNEKLAETQKQIFDFVWQFARPMKIINLNGRAVLDDESIKK